MSVEYFAELLTVIRVTTNKMYGGKVFAISTL